MRNGLKTFEISELYSKWEYNLSLNMSLDSYCNYNLRKTRIASLVQIGMIGAMTYEQGFGKG